MQKALVGLHRLGDNSENHYYKEKVGYFLKIVFTTYQKMTSKLRHS